MTGKVEGLRQLDLTVDGFWNSFYAIPVAMPPMLLTWIAAANMRLGHPGYTGTRTATVAIFGLIEIVGWVAPIVLLALAARGVGLADRFVAYVVATNWASVIVAWLMAPASILALVAPQSEFGPLAQFGAFLAVCVLSWRLTNAVLGKGAAVATGVFVAMIVVSLLLVTALQSAFGVASPG